VTTMPALFIGHGSPMNTLELNRYTNAWRSIGDALPRPRAILAISAHWYIDATAVTAMVKPRTIHDFAGFPQELFDFQYPAPGLPDLAGEVAELAHALPVKLDMEEWGLDHGTWSVLAHMFPKADVPVVQLSVHAQAPFDYHLQLGAKLEVLRRRGILIIASGNVVHNLRRINWADPEGGEIWARRFDDATAALMQENPSDIVSLASHADYALAVPTPDHFLPLLYLAGVAAAAGIGAAPMLRGYAFGGISMTCFNVGMENLARSEAGVAMA
jgi:4,5-DOPA dioxygenase extradiol